jgi:dTDP-L-rhamnose 4-epimerase
MRLLISGGAGFIGSHIADRFLREGWDVRVLDNLQPRVHPEGVPRHLSPAVELIKGDVTVAADWERALENVDVVSHQAAYQDYTPDYSQFMKTNVAGTALLFEIIAAKKFPIKKVVVASSQAVYGEGQYVCAQHGKMVSSGRKLAELGQARWEVTCSICNEPMEPCPLEEPFPKPLSPYGTSKYCQEITALGLARLLEIPCVGLRYSITQGPRQSLFNQYSGIARIFTLSLMADQAPVAYEDGLLQRDYVHIDDVVEANWLVTHDERANGEAFNVGSGKPVTVVQYARSLAKVLGKTIEPEVPGIYRLGDARHSVSSIAKLQGLGWRPKKSFDEILSHFVEWVSKQGKLERFMSDAQMRLQQMNVLRKTQAD